MIVVDERDPFFSHLQGLSEAEATAKLRKMYACGSLTDEDLIERRSRTDYAVKPI